MSFFVLAADLIGKLAVSLGGRTLGDKVKEVVTARKMDRLVEDAVDRIVEQTQEYLRVEQVSDAQQQLIITEICAKLQPLVDAPQDFFAGGLDGTTIFHRAHPNGELPQSMREEKLGQFYSVLFPQIAHFIAGSRTALLEWQAEGFREGFRRLAQLANEIRATNAKVAGLPGEIVAAIADASELKSEVLLRDFAQTLLNTVLLRLDLSPLRPERAIQASLQDMFVVPEVRERRENSQPIGDADLILAVLGEPSARRIVHGGAGVGKTTCSLWLQAQLLRAQSGRLVVTLRLREVKDIEKHSLLELLRERAGVHLRDELTNEVLRRWYDAGRLVVILDGFDEIPEERRDAVQRWIADLGTTANRSALIVTSRPLESGHLESLKGTWQQWDLLPFDEGRIVTFIERWHQHLPEGELSATERQVDPNELARTFFKDPSLKTLADTPLMLGTLLFVHHRDKQLPSGRVDLYERYIGAMLGLRDSGLGIEARATYLSDKQKRLVLALVALHFQLAGEQQVSDQQMELLVTDALKKLNFEESTDRLLPALRERTGLIQGPGAWSFTHKTIGEFLVAELICDGTHRMPDGARLDRQELWKHRSEDSWTAVLFFWAGKTTPREFEDFIKDLLATGSATDSHFALSLLHDQGGRLPREIRRPFALEILKNIHLPDNNTGYTYISTSNTPSFAHAGLKVPTVSLLGLVYASIDDAISMLFIDGILNPLDVRQHTADIQNLLLHSVLWSLAVPKSCTQLELRQALDCLSLKELALLTFSCGVDVTVVTQRTVAEQRDLIVRWVAEFPEGRPWLQILLIGAAVSYQFGSKDTQIKKCFLLGQAIWEWRGEPIETSWLLGTAACRSFLSSASFDLLAEFSLQLTDYDHKSWNLTSDQHKDLLLHCHNLIEQRGSQT